MTTNVVGGTIAGLTAVGIIVAGTLYVVRPVAAARGFGLPTWPGADAVAWLNIKGVRDIVSGLVVLVPLAMGQLHLVGWLLLIAAITPFGDAAIVVRYGGSKHLAYGMHGATAVVVVVAGLLLLLG